MTLIDISEKFEKAGIENPKAEARYLIKAVTGIDPLLQDFEMSDALQDAIEKRCVRIPLSKIMGVREFYGRDFVVNDEVLDPRPDSETLIEEALRLIQKGDVIYDLGTGSGCLLITLLLEKENVSGMAVDISQGALDVAIRNCEYYELQNRAKFRRVSFEQFKPDHKANVLISNPPYIETHIIDTLEPEVKNHDPHMALDGGFDGLIHYKQILKRLSQFLLPDSYFLLEIDDVVCDKVMDHAIAQGHYDLEIIKDLAGHNRVLKGRCKAS